MKIKIYQINGEKDKDRVKFMSYKALRYYQDSTDVNPEIYDLIYTGEVADRSLEGLFEMFNLVSKMPEEYIGRRMSVSDVIEVIESNVEKPGTYFVDSYGFKEIEFKKED